MNDNNPIGRTRPLNARDIAPASTPGLADTKGKFGSRTVEALSSTQVASGYSKVPTSTLVPDLKSGQTTVRDSKVDVLPPLAQTALAALQKWSGFQQRVDAAIGEIFLAKVDPSSLRDPDAAQKALAKLKRDMVEAAKEIGQCVGSTDLTSRLVQTCREFPDLADEASKMGHPGVLRDASLAIQTELAALAVACGMPSQVVDSVVVPSTKPESSPVPLADLQREAQTSGAAWKDMHQLLEQEMRAKVRYLSAENLELLKTQVARTRDGLFPSGDLPPGDGKVAKALRGIAVPLGKLQGMVTSTKASEVRVDVCQAQVMLLTLWLPSLDREATAAMASLISQATRPAGPVERKGGVTSLQVPDSPTSTPTQNSPIVKTEEL